MLPTPVLRLLNVLDDDYLENEEEYEGNCFLICILMSFVTNSRVDVLIHKVLYSLNFYIEDIELHDF